MYTADDHDPYEAAAEAAHAEFMEQQGQTLDDEMEAFYLARAGMDLREYNGEDE